MAHTLKPDPAFQKFNTAKEKQGHYFRFKPRSALFSILTMGIIPAGLVYYAYANEGKYNFFRPYRKEKILSGEEYTPRVKDL